MIDVNSRTWHTISAYLTQRLELLRERNDGDMAHSQTDQLRGEIRAVKDLLALPQQMAARDTTGSLGYEVGSMDDVD